MYMMFKKVYEQASKPEFCSRDLLAGSVDIKKILDRQLG